MSSQSEYLAVSAWYIHLLADFLECVSKCDGERGAGVSDGAGSVVLLICKTFRDDLGK